jgi:hypothetical protein
MIKATTLAQIARLKQKSTAEILSALCCRKLITTTVKSATQIRKETTQELP